ncbi:MAG: cupredoxin domain-containing protein [Bdellovibrio sp.]|nr:cupredoxin domain-containing protein [Bdellovibrio sp.]
MKVWIGNERLDFTNIRGWGLLFVLAVALAVLLLPSASLALSHNAVDEDDFPPSSFGTPPSPPDLAESNSPVSEKPDELQRSLASSRVSSNKTAKKGAANNKAGVQEVGLIAGDLGFFPQTVFVAPEIPVRIYITGASKKPLCFMLDDFQIRRQVRAQKIEEITFTPATPGKYRFYCPVNGIQGDLLVKEKNFVAAKRSKKVED